MLLFKLFTSISIITVLENHHVNQNHVALGAVLC